MCDVIDGRIAPYPAVPRERIELESRDAAQRQPRGASPACELRRTDEALVLVRASRHQTQYVFRGDDRCEERAEIAVQRRDKHVTAGAREPCERAEHCGG